MSRELEKFQSKLKKHLNRLLNSGRVMQSKNIRLVSTVISRVDHDSVQKEYWEMTANFSLDHVEDRTHKEKVYLERFVSSNRFLDLHDEAKHDATTIFLELCSQIGVI